MSKKLNEYAAFVLVLRNRFARDEGCTTATHAALDRKALECANKLRKLAMAYATHHERECSDEQYVNHGWIGKGNQTSAESVAERLDERRRNLAAEYDLDLRVNGDPRGYALRVMGLGVWNTWVGEQGGYGVPEE